MPRESSQKLKLLYVMRYLLRSSDEAHPVTVQQIIDFLSGEGIPAERKSIYDDVEALRCFDLDIIQVKIGRQSGYVGSREFELPELKLLVDSVQSSKFITYKKTLALIRKIESLASVYEAQLLSRQVYVKNRPEPGAKTAVTEYRLIKTSGALSLMECRLLTGRTHQIRAQMAHAGMPLLGDGKYGSERFNKNFGEKGQALYSYKLEFAFPTDAGILEYLRGKCFTVESVEFAEKYFGIASLDGI